MPCGNVDTFVTIANGVTLERVLRPAGCRTSAVWQTVHERSACSYRYAVAVVGAAEMRFRHAPQGTGVKSASGIQILRTGEGG